MRDMAEKPNYSPLDRRDLRILNELQRDGRIPNSELAARLELSESACLRRVKQLEQQGYIERYTALLNLQKIGLTVSLMVRITLKSQTDRDLRAFEEAVRGVPEVAECYLTTGESDYVLRVLAGTAADIERIHSKVLTKLPGVARVESSFVLRQVVRNATLPLPPPDTAASRRSGSAPGA
jgi:Lrp/AsnC family transcriptional regulator, leucine-responsive regulatory protein